MKITITNEFHNLSCIIRAKGIPYTLTHKQQLMAEDLCGYRNCPCRQYSYMTDDGQSLVRIGYTSDGRWVLGVRE